jgi:hypothetical protein
MSMRAVLLHHTRQCSGWVRRAHNIAVADRRDCHDGPVQRCHIEGANGNLVEDVLVVAKPTPSMKRTQAPMSIKRTQAPMLGSLCDGSGSHYDGDCVELMRVWVCMCMSVFVCVCVCLCVCVCGGGWPRRSIHTTSQFRHRFHTSPVLQRASIRTPTAPVRCLCALLHA